MSSHTYTVAGYPPIDLDQVANKLRTQIDGLDPSQPQLAISLLTDVPPVKTALVVIRGQEEPHIHPGSDLIITVLEGQGFVQLSAGTADAPLGSVILIPQGVCHAFHNNSPTDTVLLATFSPSEGSKPVSPCPPGS